MSFLIFLCRFKCFIISYSGICTNLHILQSETNRHTHTHTYTHTYTHTHTHTHPPTHPHTPTHPPTHPHTHTHTHTYTHTHTHTRHARTCTLHATSNEQQRFRETAVLLTPAAKRVRTLSHPLLRGTCDGGGPPSCCRCRVQAL